MAARERGPLARGAAARPQARAAQDRHAAGAHRRAGLQAGRVPGKSRLDDGPRLPRPEARLRRGRARKVGWVERSETHHLTPNPTSDSQRPAVARTKSRVNIAM